jgi:hypothetical protein
MALEARMNWRRISLTFFAGAAFAILFAAAPSALTGVAQAQVSAEFQAALQPYGAWRRHARWGMVWVPAKRPNGWRPYTHGHWVYTQEWGWYWISDRDEEDWGWVTYHYGRWIFDRGMGGWVWRSGNDWGPAWVAWRRSDDNIGWMAMPPDELSADYDEAPDFWVFVQPRYLTDPGIRNRMAPRTQALAALRGSAIVGRTQAQGRGARNSGVEPAVAAAAVGAPIPVYRASPRVLAGTKGVSHAVTVQPRDLAGRSPGRFGVALQKTSAIGPAAATPKPKSEPQRSSDAPAPARLSEPASPAKPHRSILPQTPPPTMPRHGARAPGAVTQMPPPAPAEAPAAKPVAKPAPATIVHAPTHPAAGPVRKPAANSVTQAKPAAASKPPSAKKQVAQKPPPLKKPLPKKKTVPEDRR